MGKLLRHYIFPLIYIFSLGKSKALFFFFLLFHCLGPLGSISSWFLRKTKSLFNGSIGIITLASIGNLEMVGWLTFRDESSFRVKKKQKQTTSLIQRLVKWNKYKYFLLFNENTWLCRRALFLVCCFKFSLFSKR